MRCAALTVLILSLTQVAAQEESAAVGPDFGGLLIELTGQHLGPPPPPLPALPPLAPVMDPLTEFRVTERPSATLTPAHQGGLDTAWVVNINTAPWQLLAQVPHLDSQRAWAIVCHREANGPFEHPTELREVFGISEWICGQLEGHLVSVGTTTFEPSAISSSPTPAAQPPL